MMARKGFLCLNLLTAMLCLQMVTAADLSQLFAGQSGAMELNIVKQQLKNTQDNLNLQIQLNAQRQQVLGGRLLKEMENHEQCQNVTKELQANLTDAETEILLLNRHINNLNLAYADIEQNFSDYRINKDAEIQLLRNKLDAQMILNSQLQNRSAITDKRLQTLQISHGECLTNVTTYSQLVDRKIQEVDNLTGEIAAYTRKLAICRNTSVEAQLQCNDRVLKCSNRLNGSLSDFANVTQQLHAIEQQLVTSESRRQVCESSLRHEQAVKSQMQNERDICIGDLLKCNASFTGCLKDYNSTTNATDDCQNRLASCAQEVSAKDLTILVLNKKIMNCDASLRVNQKAIVTCKTDASSVTAKVKACQNETTKCKDKVKEFTKQLSSALADQTTHVQCKSNLAQLQDKLGKTSALKNCAAWQKKNFSSGEYLIDPDGEDNGLPAFNVYCKFENGTTETHVKHNSQGQFSSSPASSKCDSLDKHGIGYKEKSKRKTYSKWNKREEDSGSDENDRKLKDRHSFCQGQKFTYGPSRAQLEILKSVSMSCTQSISWDCFDQSALTVFSQDGEFSRRKWDSRTQLKNYYFSFSPSGPLECACASQSACLSDMGCNCYADDSSWQHDDILITKMSDLPITQVALGDLNNSKEMGKVTLGDLVCV